MTFKDLTVYKKSIDFVVQIYQLTRSFPDIEKFGIVSQIQRAATSIPANIAEGSQRQSRAEYVKFLYVSYGSCAEVETFLEISFKLNYVDKKTFEELQSQAEELSKMLRGLINKLKSNGSLEPTNLKPRT